MRRTMKALAIRRPQDAGPSFAPGTERDPQLAHQTFRTLLKMQATAGLCLPAHQQLKLMRYFERAGETDSAGGAGMTPNGPQGGQMVEV